MQLNKWIFRKPSKPGSGQRLFWSAQWCTSMSLTDYHKDGPPAKWGAQPLAQHKLPADSAVFFNGRTHLSTCWMPKSIIPLSTLVKQIVPDRQWMAASAWVMHSSTICISKYRVRCVRSVFFGGRLTVYHFGGCAANTCMDLCGRRCATQVVMVMYECLMGSDHVFQVLRACYIWTDMQSCQGCPPYMTVVGKPVMDNRQVRKEWCSSYTFGALSGSVHMSACVCVCKPNMSFLQLSGFQILSKWAERKWVAANQTF